MLIHNPIFTGSISLNGTDISKVSTVSTDSSSFALRITNNESTSSAYVTTSGSFSNRITNTESTSSQYVTASGSLAARLTSNEARTGSYASTGSNQFSGSQTITGSLTATGTITAQTLVVQTITSSVEYVSGSNRFGSTTGNTHEFTGSVLVSGSVTTSVGSGIVVGGGSLSYAASSTRGAMSINGSTDRMLNFGPNDYIYNSDTLFRVLTSTATTNMDFVVGGVQRLFISGSGNVGIGVSSPSRNLHVASSGTDTTIAATRNGTDSSQIGVDTVAYIGAGGDFTIRTGGFTSSTERMRITSGGVVGIGITNPTKKLDVYDANTNGTDDIIKAYQNLTTNHAFYRSQRNGGANMLIGATRDNTDGNLVANTSIVWNASNHDMLLGTNNTERIRILSGGNVGIGTTNPAYKLQSESGGVASYFKGGNGGYAAVAFTGDNNTTIGVLTTWSSGIYLGRSNGSYNSQFGANPDLFIDSSGNVGINTTSPGGWKFRVISSADGAQITSAASTQTLNLLNASANPTILRINNNNGNFYDIQNNYSNNSLTFDYNDTTRMTILSNGAIIAGRTLGNGYSQTSSTGTTSIIDTGITYDTGDYGGYGRGTTYQVVYHGNANAAGSGAYFSQYMGILMIYTGWSGSAVTTYIQYTQLAGGSNVGTLTLTPYFWNGSSQVSSIGVYTGGYQIRLRIDGYNSSYVGADQAVYLTRLSS